MTPSASCACRSRACRRSSGLSERRAQVAETRAAEADATIGERELDLADRVPRSRRPTRRIPRLGAETGTQPPRSMSRKPGSCRRRTRADRQAARALGGERDALLARLAAAQAQALDAGERQRLAAEAGIARLNLRLSRGCRVISSVCSRRWPSPRISAGRTPKPIRGASDRNASGQQQRSRRRTRRLRRRWASNPARGGPNAGPPPPSRGPGGRRPGSNASAPRWPGG